MANELIFDTPWSGGGLILADPTVIQLAADPTAAGLILTTGAPLVGQTRHRFGTPPVASLGLSAAPPLSARSSHHFAALSSGLATLAGAAVTSFRRDHHLISPATYSRVLSYDLVSTSGVSTWTHSGRSLEGFIGNGDAEWSVADNAGLYGVGAGLNAAHTASGLSDLTYGWYVNTVGDTATVVENGLLTATAVAWSLGDTLSVARVGTTVTYYLNGVPQKSTAGTSLADMALDSAIFGAGSRIVGAKINGIPVSWGGLLQTTVEAVQVASLLLPTEPPTLAQTQNHLGMPLSGPVTTTGLTPGITHSGHCWLTVGRAALVMITQVQGVASEDNQRRQPPSGSVNTLPGTPQVVSSDHHLFAVPATLLVTSANTLQADVSANHRLLITAGALLGSGSLPLLITTIALNQTPGGTNLVLGSTPLQVIQTGAPRLLADLTLVPQPERHIAQVRAENHGALVAPETHTVSI